ncbi:MAG: ATP-binding protein, partial [Persicimonas sp.]
MPFVNREYELERLRELANDDRRNLALIYGRRRIGKTYLLT